MRIFIHGSFSSNLCQPKVWHWSVVLNGIFMWGFLYMREASFHSIYEWESKIWQKSSRLVWCSCVTQACGKTEQMKEEQQVYRTHNCIQNQWISFVSEVHIHLFMGQSYTELLKYLSGPITSTCSFCSSIVFSVYSFCPRRMWIKQSRLLGWPSLWDQYGGGWTRVTEGGCSLSWQIWWSVTVPTSL